jgi:catechol 2,3-dioxygenase-like lactoylglutathione lyase family enzyme
MKAVDVAKMKMWKTRETIQMKLNHLNLTVSDVQAARNFLETYFGLRGMESFPGDDNFAILFDEDGFALSLMRLNAKSEAKYPGNFHIGFMQGSEERVNEINQRLKDDGYRVPAPKQFHGSWTFYMKAPGGFTVEVLC